jgi:polyprenyl P-hydroxybenzoate and phenylacrylic acid decarboxylases
MKPIKQSSILLAMTGASGSLYTQMLLQELLKQTELAIYFIYSKSAQIVAKQEIGWHLSQDIDSSRRFLSDFYQRDLCNCQLLTIDDWFSPVASGSNGVDQMVICPCSMGTLASISHGISDNLIERAADVVLKEKRRLIISPRESPLSSIHLENMLKLSQMGALIIPLMPGFYHQPQSVEEIISFMVMRLLKALGIKSDKLKKWGDPLSITNSI